MQKIFLAFAAVSGGLSVIIGALGAHALKAKLPVDALQSFETGVKYQMYHSLALIFIALLMFKMDSKFLHWAGYCYMTGIVLFSGSIYLLSTKSITDLSWGWLGPITPIGGVFLISGWVFVLTAVLNSKLEI